MSWLGAALALLVWRRQRLGTYLLPVTRDDPRLLEVLDRLGWTLGG